MNNPVTNRLRLIEVVSVEGLSLFGNVKIQWFDKVISPLEGIHQEIYRGKTYIGSVSSLGQQPRYAKRLTVKARKGDSIYRVSLTPQPYDFTGIIKTKDGYKKMYEVHIQLQVVNPSKCIECYCNSQDPANLVIARLKMSFENFFSRYTHDSLGNVNAGFDTLSKQMNFNYGITIEKLSWSFYSDPQRDKELEIQQEIELKKRKIMAEAEIKLFELYHSTKLKKEEITSNSGLAEQEDEIEMRRERIQKQFERDEKAKQNDFLRAEKIKTQLNEARIKLLSMTLNDLIAINSERLRDAFDTNASVGKVLEESLKLLAVFTPINNSGEEVVDSNLLNGDLMVELEAEDKGPDTDINPIPFSKNQLDNAMEPTSSPHFDSEQSPMTKDVEQRD